MAQSGTGDVAEVVARMRRRLARMTPDQQGPRAFLDTYLRTTVAVGEAIERGFFEDGRWVEAWDVAFADLYFEAFDADALGGGRVPQPWRLAFDAPRDLPALRHVLLGINAHINYDLPQALLAVIGDDDFADPDVMGLRRRDHERIDSVLSARVTAEARRLAARSPVPLLDRVLQPVNRRASRRFLRQARKKVWHNALELQGARLAGPVAYEARLGELETLSAGGVADLMAPGPVLVRLGIAGSGVVLPPH
jgi:hypothetical protein